MRTLESWTPRRGLSVPILTLLDPDGGLEESDQRRLTRYLIQSGRGADIIFANGTTGECGTSAAHKEPQNNSKTAV